MTRFWLIIFVVFIVCACSNINNKDKVENKFTLLSSELTGIEFINKVTDVEKSNIFIHETFYHGGGVAIGDINNDGLQDLFFSGNQVSDKLYLNKGDFIFEDITMNSGIIIDSSWSTGASFVDINNDGLLDISVSKSLYEIDNSLRKNRIYINNGDLTFSEKSAEMGLDDSNRTMNTLFLDYDGDGDLDVFNINHPPNPSVLSKLYGRDWLDTTFSCRLYENIDLKFVDVTKKAGLLNRGYSLSGTIADFNNDGWPDIYVANDFDSPDFLYINMQDGTYENKINEYLMHTSNFSMGTDAADINNDGYLDLAVLDMVAEDNFRIKANMSGMNPDNFWRIYEAGGHRQYMFNTFQLNNGKDENGDLTFSEIGQMLGVSSTDWSWSPLIADFDNSGFKDFFISNGIKRDMRNTDATTQAELVIKQKLGPAVRANGGLQNLDVWDYVNLEELLNIFPSNPLKNYIFKNLGQLNFENVSDKWGLDEATFSTGAAYGDLDNDGDLDIVLNNVDGKAFIYRNNTLNTNYLRVKLTQNGRNFSPFGAKVEIVLSDKNQYFEFTSARGFFSASEPIAHFGLGKHESIDKVIVNWPNGSVSIVDNPKINQILTVDSNSAVDILKENTKSSPYIFTDITDDSSIDFVHKENEFDDFEREILLPHKMSQFGPALAKGDFNNDGLEDFFIGGAKGQAGVLYIQNSSNKFTKLSTDALIQDKDYEDMGAAFVDIDNDSDLDLYVVSGGNEAKAGNAYYQDRLYINDGNGRFTKAFLPPIRISGSIVIPNDYDNDGDIDLFIGGRQVPGNYPMPASSILLKNELIETGNLNFSVIDDGPFKNLGMVTDAVWEDLDNDGDDDLIISRVWQSIAILSNNNGNFVNETSKYGLDSLTGWWYSLTPADVDNDGDIDFIAGNLGLNYKYKASHEEPFTVHYDDFDSNGSADIVLGYYNYGNHFPLRGRSCSSQQVPSIKKKFPNYTSFAQATIDDVYGSESLENALSYSVSSFASVVLINNDGKFEIKELPAEAQISSINDVVVKDFDSDGNLDLVIAGNLYTSEIETPRADAGMGLLMYGDGTGDFKAVPAFVSGLFLKYDVKNLIELTNKNGKTLIIAACNDDRLRIIKHN